MAQWLNFSITQCAYVSVTLLLLTVQLPDYSIRSLITTDASVAPNVAGR